MFLYGNGWTLTPRQPPVKGRTAEVKERESCAPTSSSHGSCLDDARCPEERPKAPSSPLIPAPVDQLHFQGRDKFPAISSTEECSTCRTVQERQKSKGRSRRRFSQEVRQDGVEMVGRSARPIAELSMYESTLGNWVPARQVDEGEREGVSTEERQRLRELERQNTERRHERDLLR